MRLACTVEEQSANGNLKGHWRREITFPFPPFPGMIVGGGFRVVRVLVCQGGLDGQGAVSVVLDRQRLGPMERSIMLDHGWRWESYT